MPLYGAQSAPLLTSRGGKERVKVNQRTLIDKILAGYAGAGAMYRELLQKSNNADATIADLYSTTASSSSSCETTRTERPRVIPEQAMRA
jgi:hypothetical protein